MPSCQSRCRGQRLMARSANFRMQHETALTGSCNIQLQCEPADLAHSAISGVLLQHNYLMTYMLQMHLQNLCWHVFCAGVVQQRLAAGAFEQLCWDWDLHGVQPNPKARLSSRICCGELSLKLLMHDAVWGWRSASQGTTSFCGNLACTLIVLE